MSVHLRQGCHASVCSAASNSPVKAEEKEGAVVTDCLMQIFATAPFSKEHLKVPEVQRCRIHRYRRLRVSCLLFGEMNEGYFCLSSIQGRGGKVCVCTCCSVQLAFKKCSQPIRKSSEVQPILQQIVRKWI